MSDQSSFSVSIPKPCHEDWNKMTPNQQGAFCKQCCKTVVDFTRKSTAEIKDFFTEVAGQKICGRFNTTQLTPVPVKVSPQKKQFFARFALALYMVFGSVLFTSCGTDEQRVGKVAPLDTTQRMGDVEPERHDTGTVKTHNTQTTLPENNEHVKGKTKISSGADTTKPKCIEKTMGKPEVLMGDVTMPENENKGE